ncbi:MAG: hypothetical protein K0S65_5763, partial [Labilithrix sp.]|nr:hypothetical protein [Labilithrix sp.]
MSEPHEPSDVAPDAPSPAATSLDATTTTTAEHEHEHEGGSPYALEPTRIRARRRPGMVLFVWAWELVCAFFIATPVHAFAKAVWGSHPDGDAVVFRPGGRSLLTWLGDEGPALAVVLRTTFLLFVL